MSSAAAGKTYRGGSDPGVDLFEEPVVSSSGDFDKVPSVCPSLADVNRSVTKREKTFTWTSHNLIMRDGFSAMDMLTAGPDGNTPD